MSKKTKFWLIAAALLVLIGCVIFAGAMKALKWDFGVLSTERYETSSYDIGDAFYGISVKTDTADIVFLPSEDGRCRVVCYEEEKAKHEVKVQDGILVIHENDRREWYERIGIHFDSPKITIYLPKGAYGTLSVTSDTGCVSIPDAFTFEGMDIIESTGAVTNYASVTGAVKIRTSTGSIRVEKASVGELDLSVSTGKVTVKGVACGGNVTVKVSTGKTELIDVTCQDLTSDGSTGSISLTNVIASGRLAIERSTGNVNFDRSDAAEIAVTTDTGDVKGNLLTDKIFIAKSDTGRVIVPETTVGGRCEIRTDTGNIKITVDGSKR